MQVAAIATMEVVLAPQEVEVALDDVGYRWELVAEVDGSRARTPVGDASARFTPDLRGAYVVERWIEAGIAERLSHRFEIAVAGTPPIAQISVGAAAARIGQPFMFDAVRSASPEGRTLTHAWRLVTRPPASTAELTGAETSVATLVFDIVGVYEIELVVSDGELASAPRRASVTPSP